MRSARTFAAVALWAAWLCTVAKAAPRIVVSDEQVGAEVRTVAAQFYSRIADGDQHGASDLFAGPWEDAKLLDAEVAFVAGTDELAKSFDARFGNADPQTSQRLGRTTFQRVADRQLHDVIILNGDSACTAIGGSLEPGLELQRTLAGWRVIHLTTAPGQMRRLLSFFVQSTLACEEVRAKIDAGVFANVALAKAELNRREEPLTSELMRGFGRPSVLPASSPVATTSPSGPDLSQARAWLGKPFNAPQIADITASLPGTPRVATYDDAMFIMSFEAGCDLSFHLPDGKLQAIHFFSDGSEGFDRYKGPLPFGLRFGEPRWQVEATLGKPDGLGAGFCSYDMLGLGVDYFSEAPRDPDNPVARITISSPRPGVHRVAVPPGKPPFLTFRFVVSPASPESKDAQSMADPDDPSGKIQLLVSNEPILDENSIANVGLISPQMNLENLWQASLTMTPEGGRKLKQATAGKIGQRIAITWAGRVLMAATIRDPLESHVMVDFGTNGTKQQCVELAAQIGAVIFSLPSTQPSPNRPAK